MTAAALSALNALNPVSFAMSTTSTPLLATAVSDLFDTTHVSVAAYTAGAVAPKGNAFASTVWQLMTGSLPLTVLATGSQGSAGMASYPVWSFCHRSEATPPAADLALLMAFTPGPGGPSPFTGKVASDPDACVFLQIRAPRLTFAMQGDVRRRASRHLLTLWASLLGVPFQGMLPVGSGGPCTIGNVPIMPDIERQLLLDQYSGWTENQSREVPLVDGETLPDVWGRTARAYPDVRRKRVLITNPNHQRCRQNHISVCVWCMHMECGKRWSGSVCLIFFLACNVTVRPYYGLGDRTSLSSASPKKFDGAMRMWTLSRTDWLASCRVVVLDPVPTWACFCLVRVRYNIFLSQSVCVSGVDV
jgi:hypothetical protein